MVQPPLNAFKIDLNSPAGTWNYPILVHHKSRALTQAELPENGAGPAVGEVPGLPKQCGPACGCSWGSVTLRQARSLVAHTSVSPWEPL